MKKHIKRRSVSILSVTFLGIFFFPLLLPRVSRAGDGDEVTRKRSINKSYTISAGYKLDIENQFGTVTISTWDKNEITVDIDIEVKAATDDKAGEIMDNIDVKDAQNGNTISFKTKVGEMHNRNQKHRGGKDENSFSIDYTIHMPAANPLRVENSFGKIFVPDFLGQVDLTSKFGSLEAGKLSNVDAIDVEFGSASIAELNNGKITLKFDKQAEIRKLSGDVKISSEFSQRVQLGVADDIGELSLSESYSDVHMVVGKDLSAEFVIHTSFGKFDNDSDFNIQEKKSSDNDEGPHFDKDYSGRAGEGKARIKINSSFGSVHLSHVSSGAAI